MVSLIKVENFNNSSVRKCHEQERFNICTESFKQMGQEVKEITSPGKKKRFKKKVKKKPVRVTQRVKLAFRLSCIFTRLQVYISLSWIKSERRVNSRVVPQIAVSRRIFTSK